MDITELILSDHHEQRRMFAQLDDLIDADRVGLGAVWRRMRILLEVHAEAEERLFYPLLLTVGSGAGDKDSAADEALDAVSDHNEIRDAIAETERHEVGTQDWWAGVDATRRANGDHMAEEEREALADFRRSVEPSVRHDLGVLFASFEADHASGIDSHDKNPEDYVDRMSESAI